MKKVGFIIAILIVIIVVFILENKLYYPSLPIENLSAKKAIDKLIKSDNKIVEIAVEGDFIWYITNADTSVADENIKEMLHSYGWKFKDKEGAGLFFEKDGKRLITTTQMWTKNFVLVKIPSSFKYASAFEYLAND